MRKFMESLAKVNEFIEAGKLDQAAALLQNGAGYMQIAAFISTLMMVGVVTIPIEISYFGKKATITRNISAFVFSLVVAWIIGVLM